MEADIVRPMSHYRREDPPQPRDLLEESRAIARDERRLGLLPERQHIVFLLKLLEHRDEVIRQLAGVAK